MKYAVVGCGRTGGEVIDLLKGEEVVGVYDTKRLVVVEELKEADVVIVFVDAEGLAAVLPLLEACGRPVVCGTTGYDWGAFSDKGLKEAGVPWIVGSNFSIGMNLMFFFASELGGLMKAFSEMGVGSAVGIHEVHHVNKKDRPSGTAVMLERFLGLEGVRVISEREGDVKGEHRLEVKWGDEAFRMGHEAGDRKIFAKGAIWAANHLVSEGVSGVNSFEELIHKKWRKALLKV